MSNDIRDLNVPARHARFQFTIRSMLIFTAIVAVVCSVLFAMPDWMRNLVLLFATFMIPGILVTLLVYGNRDQRTFSIGALFPSGFVMLAMFGISGIPPLVFFDDRRAMATFWLVAALNGYLCIVTRRRIEKRRKAEESRPSAGTDSRP